MNKKTIIIIAAIIAVFGTVIGVSALQKANQPNIIANDKYQLSAIEDRTKKINYDSYELHSIIEPNDSNGNFAENIKGDPTKAKVVIYEYADYQCSYCAAMNTYINQIVEDYEGEVAAVFRSYVLNYHQNGVAAASAANAAALQGCWGKYKDLLFANQNDWFYSTAEELQNQLEGYFTAACGEKADLEKFRTDIKSDAVAQKIAFDLGAGEKLDIGGTPWFYVDGEWIENNNYTPTQYAQKIREVIDKKLKK